MKKMVLFGLITGITVLFTGAQETPSVSEILEKVDENMVFETATVEAEMVITIKNRVITKRFTSYSEGNEKSFIEFLSPARDRGTKILKTGDIVKIYYPSAERILRLSGHMLRQSMMGSDFSYEDMTERSRKLREEYSGKVISRTEWNGSPCYVMELVSKLPKQTYFTRKIWVDRDRYLGLREELYARSGKLLKVMTVDEINTYRNRYYPVKVTLEDKLRENSRTEMVIKKIEFDVPIPPGTFTERNLMKK